MRKLLCIALMILVILVSASFVPIIGQAQAADTTTSLVSDLLPADKDGLYYKLTTATATNDGAALTLGDSSAKVFTTEATLSKWNSDVSLAVSLPLATETDKSFTWNTAVKIAASVDRIDGGLVVTPEKVIYPYNDITDLVLYKLPPDAQNEGGSFEYELKLYSIPKSNVFTFNIQTKNLEFYYQPSLTLAEIKNGDIRPDNVVGSYAVYHSSKSNNEFKSGKAFHIYRPKVIDALGNWQWATLNIDPKAGLMTVTVEQKFLDNAVYPVLIDPTFGYTTSGANSGNLENVLVAGLYASGGSGVVTSMSGWFNSNGDNVRTVTTAIYNSSYSLLAASSQDKTVPSGTTQIDFAISLSISSTNYYLAARGDSGLNSSYLRYDSSGTGLTVIAFWASGWPDPISGYTTNTNKYSIWATYVQIPTVTQSAATNVAKNSVTLNGEVTNAGGGTITERGFDYDTDSGAPYANNWHETGSWGAATFNSGSGITGLTAGTLYYFRSYGVNEGGTGYSTEGNFTTSPDTPLVVNDGYSSLLSTSVTLKGNITAIRGATPTTYGFEWDYDSSGIPYASSWTSGAGSYGVGAYSHAVTTLSPGTEYWWRFVATNSAGQGNSTEAKLLSLPVKPSSLADGTKTDVAITYTWNAGSGAQQTMVRYSSSAYPTAISEGTQAYFGNLTTTNITSLTPNTLYYVSAWSYTTIDGMTAYSSDYATDTAYTRPSDVSVLDAHSPTVNSIDLDWGNTTGADKYMVRSSTTGYPSSPSDGTQTYFGTDITTTHNALQPGKQYFYVVYAYGNSSGLYSTNPAQDTETTLVDVPIVTNNMGATGIGKTYATLNGLISYTGGENPTAKFYWGDNDGGTDPGSWDTEENMGVQSASFSKAISSLTEGNTYYYRTYGINSAGVDWADSTFSFTAGILNPTSLTASKINNYQIDLSWVSAMPISRIVMGIDNPPANALEGTFVYWGNATNTSYYVDTTDITGNMTFRLWADGTTFYPIAFGFSDNYAEDSIILAASGAGDMTKAVYDTNNDGVVNSADYAALAGDADTLDGHHWIEIPGGGGNITFITDSGNVTGTLFYLLGSGTITTSVDGGNITISGDLTIVTDSGNATSVTGVLSMLGSGNTTTSGASSTVTINSSGNITNDITFITDLGNATSINGIVTLTGTDIEITGNSSTIGFGIGGENVGILALFAAMFFGLALMGFGYLAKSLAVMIGAAMAWMGIAVYSYSQSTGWDIYRVMGALAMALIFVCLLVSIKQDSDKKADAQKLIVKPEPPKSSGERYADWEKKTGTKPKEKRMKW